MADGASPPSLGALLLGAALVAALVAAGHGLLLGPLSAGSTRENAAIGEAPVRSLGHVAVRDGGGAVIALEEVLAVVWAQPAPLQGLAVDVWVEGGKAPLANGSAADGRLRVTVLRDADGSAAGPAGQLGEGDVLRYRLEAPAPLPLEVLRRSVTAPGWPVHHLALDLARSTPGPEVAPEVGEVLPRAP